METVQIFANLEKQTHPVLIPLLDLRPIFQKPQSSFWFANQKSFSPLRAV